MGWSIIMVFFTHKMSSKNGYRYLFCGLYIFSPFERCNLKIVRHFFNAFPQYNNSAAYDFENIFDIKMEILCKQKDNYVTCAVCLLNKDGKKVGSMRH